MDDEQVLVAQAKQDRERFALLYDRYVERIYAYACREMHDIALAQDVTSATFEQALRHLGGYQWQGTSFGAWLYQIARNEMRMQYRRQKWTVPLWSWLVGGRDLEQTFQEQSDLTAVQRAMNQLKGRDQEILRLHYFEQLSHDEIGQVLGCSSRNVAVRLHRALERLRHKVAAASPEVRYDILI
ncbi:MAG: sigma-70 family RNA polymerase sigma factor [Anaerolineae bacterium]|nr:sigma-70 family RNA polymerase sigma factor [Anaerolineae bacterium]